MGWLSLKKTQVQQAVAKTLSSVWTSSTSSGDISKNAKEVAKEYHRNLYLWTCVQKIVTVSAVPPLYVAAEKDRALDEYESRVQAVLTNPNPQWTQAHLVEFVTLSLAVTTRAFLHVVRGVGKVPLEIWPLDPTRVTVNYIEGTSTIKSFTYQEGLNRRIYPVEEDGTSDIIFLQRASLDPTKAPASPAEVAVPPAEFFNRILQKGADIAGNASNITGVLSTETDVDQKSVEKVRDRLDDFKTGGRSSGDTLVIANAKWNFSRLSEDPSAVMSTEVKDSLARDVCAVMGVPSQLVSIPGSQTYANYETAMWAFITDTIIPSYLGPLVSELTRGLLTTRPVPSGRTARADVKVMFDVDAWPAMVKARLALVDIASKASFLSTNEKRELMGYPKSPDPAAELIPDLEKLDLERLKVEMTTGTPEEDLSAEPT